MDLPASTLTPEEYQDLGAQAFHDGRAIDDHHMNPGAPAIADWQNGWRAAQAKQLAGSTPP